MSWSLGEIRALSVKATRGTGMDWGIAEEAGFAVEWLEAKGLQGVKALSQYLSHVHQSDEFDFNQCPLRLGCLVSDTNDWSFLKDKPVVEPMLLIPFIAAILDDKCLTLSWDDNTVQIQNSGVATDDLETLVTELNIKKCIIDIEHSHACTKPINPKSRVLEDAKPHIKTLNALAHNTYAPATEASRLAGAGAGLNDND